MSKFVLNGDKKTREVIYIFKNIFLVERHKMCNTNDDNFKGCADNLVEYSNKVPKGTPSRSPDF